MVDEGVIKFEAEHRQERLEPGRYGDLACRLAGWREVLAKLQLVGQDPARYGGAGYGNVSARVGPRGMPRGKRSMLISGTQTGGVPRLGLSHLCLVEAYDYARNRVVSRGALRPSSETMTHGAIYDLSPAIAFVFHAHCPELWQHAAALRLPTTDPRIAYGTPEMAREVQRLYHGTTLSAVRILAMGGHEDGIIVFGETAEEAGAVLVRQLARAHQLVCRGAMAD
ncbi:MAG: class II aldolase/adducin family protein [Polyangiaceae bacterium]